MTRPIDQADVDAVLERRYNEADLANVDAIEMHALRSDALSWLNAVVALGWRPPARPGDDGPQVGQTWESRDTQYEPGRQVILISRDDDGFLVKTTANPSRPHRVGKEASISRKTLLSKWRRVEEATDAR
ncbi:hypothetical protein KIH74_22555 [Kineosporia sp. J2-2]|uniref:Uncharacterized protein n=1 Tax=Kineosporia corallincola TaxID=2835133 RepID=A0ABS5TKW2_9ACTN|nr:hypothetical protein [Kineosporia corallincola]MBT0771739.1 hypothetical protein [Kineosporia corallincola]